MRVLVAAAAQVVTASEGTPAPLAARLADALTAAGHDADVVLLPPPADSTEGALLTAAATAAMLLPEPDVVIALATPAQHLRHPRVVLWLESCPPAGPVGSRSLAAADAVVASTPRCRREIHGLSGMTVPLLPVPEGTGAADPDWATVVRMLTGPTAPAQASTPGPVPTVVSSGGARA